MRGSSGAPVTSHDAVSRHSVRRHLRIEIDAYDRTIRRFIPGYGAMVEAAAGAIAAAGAQAVVDLGAGTGALSEAILSRSGTTAVELIDVDPEMLAQARRRLARFGRRARFREASFLAPLPPCGGAAAALALHHVPALDDKRALYRRVHDALHPGGLFVNADAAVPADPAARAATYDAWADHMASCGIERNARVRAFRGVGRGRRLLSPRGRAGRDAGGRVRRRVRLAPRSDGGGRRAEGGAAPERRPAAGVTTAPHRRTAPDARCAASPYRKSSPRPSAAPKAATAGARPKTGFSNTRTVPLECVLVVTPSARSRLSTSGSKSMT